MTEWNELTEKEKKMFQEAIERHKKRLETANQPDKKDYSIYTVPRSIKLTEEEKEIPVKFEEFLDIQDDAIKLVKKHIKRLEDEDPVIHESMIKGLKEGLGVLEGGKEKTLKEGSKWLLDRLERYGRGCRPLFGLQRGFGEFLHNPPYSTEPWTDEIMKAVRKIEHYYNNI